MTTDISVRSETYLTEDHSWLGSAHGTEATPTITLAVSTFTEGTHYPNGFIPSGVVLGKITSGPDEGLYGPYDNGADDGRETAAGHLFALAKVRSGGPNVGSALLEHGFVVEAKLPAGHGLDANAKTDLAGRLIYR